jgi:hypothetical protein
MIKWGYVSAKFVKERENPFDHKFLNACYKIIRHADKRKENTVGGWFVIYCFWHNKVLKKIYDELGLK